MTTLPRLLLLTAALLGALLSAALAQPPAAPTQTAPPVPEPPQGIAPGEPHPNLGQPDPRLLRYLSISGNNAGRWSADGQWIAFSTNWTGTSQKWLMDSRGGFPRRITFFEDAVEFCDFSPHDPALMWLGVASGGNERTQLYFTSPDGILLEPLAVNPDVIHRPGDWSRDGRYISYTSNARDERFFDVYVLDTQTDQHKLVFQRDANMSAGEFSPDGRFLLASINTSNVNNDVWLIDHVNGGELHLTPHEGEAEFNGYYWADADTLYYVTNQDREFGAIARIEVPTGVVTPPGETFGQWSSIDWRPRPELIHTPEYDVENLQLSEDGRYIAWVENVDGFGELHLATVPDLAPLAGAQGQELPPPALPRGLQAAGRFSPDGSAVILQASGTLGPTDLYRYDLATGATDRLTYASLGGIPTESFVTPEVVKYKSYDGLEISALWYAPPGAPPAGGWPVIIEAHGGPEGQSRPWFDPQKQLYLSLGVGILAPNVRGSSGYGKTFMTLDNVELRENSVADYAAAADWLVAEGLGAADRIAISGGSYGGYAVLAALTLYPEKWAAGVDAVGIANFVTFLENTGPYRRAIREAEYGSLEADRELLERISPIHRVENITAPLLIIHGANDPRVPLGEAQQMHDALRALGREVDLLAFVDEGHGLLKLENRALAWQRELEFMKRNLGL